MNREKRIEIFEDTMSAVLDEVITTDSTTDKHNFGDIVAAEHESVNNISVENLDTVSALAKYHNEGKTCLLNMASYKHPGGGVARGAQAQEECLYRCSNLFETTHKEFYPLMDDECLYTKDAVFFKDKHYNYIDPITTDVVTIAAINLNKNSRFDDIKQEWVEGIVDKEDNYETLTKQKIRLMLSLAIKNGIDNIVLGAWGCGVFKNEPSDMSRMFKEVLVNENYSGSFKNVIFAIINDHNSKGDNFDVFTKAMKENGKG